MPDFLVHAPGFLRNPVQVTAKDEDAARIEFRSEVCPGHNGRLDVSELDGDGNPIKLEKPEKVRKKAAKRKKTTSRKA